MLNPKEHDFISIDDDAFVQERSRVTLLISDFMSATVTCAAI